MDQLYPIGTILSTHGYAGHLKVRISKFELKDCNNLQSFFLLQNDKPIPFFIEEIRYTKDNEAIIKLEDYNTKEEASHLKSYQIYLHEDELVSIDRNESLTDWLQFEIIDQQLGSLGMVQDVFEYPAQLMIQLVYNDEEKLIPMHEDFIISMDHEKNQIQVNLPEGILEI